MKKHSWLQRLWTVLASNRRRGTKRRCTARPTFEALENRTLPSGNAPFVESINRTNPASLGTNQTGVTYTVTFNEAVTGVNTGDFELALTGTAHGTISQVTPISTAVYTVAVTGITGAGTLGLNLVDNGAIHDLAGDRLISATGAASFNDNDQSFFAGPGPHSLAVADLTGDGNPDLVVADDKYGGA